MDDKLTIILNVALKYGVGLCNVMGELVSEHKHLPFYGGGSCVAQDVS